MVYVSMEKYARMVIDEVTDELAEVIADLQAKISCDEPEAYGCMTKRVEKAQEMLLRLLEKLEKE
jgi:hypothetical protein